MYVDSGNFKKQIFLKDSGDVVPTRLKPGSTLVVYNYLVQTFADNSSSSSAPAGGNMEVVTTTIVNFTVDDPTPFKPMLSDGFKAFDVKLGADSKSWSVMRREAGGSGLPRTR